MWDRFFAISDVRIASDSFTKAITLDWPQVRDEYFEAFRKISLPFLDLVSMAGVFERSKFLTRENIQNIFAAYHPQMRLF